MLEISIGSHFLDLADSNGGFWTTFSSMIEGRIAVLYENVTCCLVITADGDEGTEGFGVRYGMEVVEQFGL